LEELRTDWKRLADVNFLIYRRMTNYLSAALGAVNLIGTDTEQSLEYWKQRAIKQLMRANQLYSAWNHLLQMQGVEQVSPPSQRLFRASDLMEWLAAEMTQHYPHHPDHDRLLQGNREMLQEALLLIYSASYSLGPGVRLLTQSMPNGIWFRIRYNLVKKAPPTLDGLLETLTTDWRSEMTAFELFCASEFLALNSSGLEYVPDEQHATLGFFIPACRPMKADQTETVTATPASDNALEEPTRPYNQSAIWRRIAQVCAEEEHTPPMPLSPKH
jgi:hypothetical protein